MKKAQEIDVKGMSVRIVKFGVEDYVCITDMAKSKSDDAQQTISNWMCNRMTIECLELWEKLYNPDFEPFGFEGFRKDVGLNSFTMSPSNGLIVSTSSRSSSGPQRAKPMPLPVQVIRFSPRDYRARVKKVSK